MNIPDEQFSYMDIAHDLVMCRIIYNVKHCKGARSFLDDVWKQYINLIKRWGME